MAWVTIAVRFQTISSIAITMRASQFLLATLKETPTDAEIVSHRLMLRSGMVRRLAAGIYSWLPLGLRVVQKIERVIREEMNRSGAQEVLLPAVQPAELWQQSGRWDAYGPELLRLTDRHDRSFCFGPTHEEVITTLIRNEVRSYRQLPANFYQIQTKFRDEIRPRFGVMRGREFIMKDAYSFDLDDAGLQKTYECMYDAYERIFARLGLEARAVEADSGAIGGNVSHEFHVLADSGEDGIALCEVVGYSANVERVTLPPPVEPRPAPERDMARVATPGQHTIEDLCNFLDVEAPQTLKTLIVDGTDGPIALVLRGDHELNAVKAESLPQIRAPLRFSTANEIRSATGADPGSVGPVDLPIPCIVDYSAAVMSDFVCGANEDDVHLIHVNWGRDTGEPETADLRKATEGDPCPSDPSQQITVRRGIEVGHIFQLGTKYSAELDATYLDAEGTKQPMVMGCYGIGVTRISAAAIEQNHDENGIIWPDAIAPFDVCIVPVGYHKSAEVSKAADELHDALQAAGMEVLLDDREERPGVMFSEMDLIGIPHRLVVSGRGLKSGTVEYRARKSGESRDIPLEDLVTTLIEMREL